MELTMFEWLFVGEYLKDFNATQAMIRAGYAGEYAGQDGYRMLKKPKIRDEVEAARKQIIGKVQLQVQDIVQDIKDVLTGDARDLIEQRVGSCRHCWGDDHRYQFKSEEWRKALRDDPEADPCGGVGYMRKREPHPDCPECEGDGESYTVVHDTRSLSPAAAALYEGLKPTSNGIEIKMRSKDAAREAAARYLGMNKHTIDVNVAKKAKDMTDDELMAEIEKESAK